MSGRFPFPAYLNGWFRAAFSGELAPGDVMPLHYFGRDLVLFRGESGEAHLLDAHCPHLGAHLGHGGCVEGDAIRCPFHAWLWSADGDCLEVPYSRRVPANVSVPAWPVVERNGVVFFWHDAHGRPPSFEVPVLPEIGASDWTPFDPHKYLIRSHWVDMNENAVDSVHFHYVHGTPVLPRFEVETHDHELHIRTPADAVMDIRSIDWGPGFRAVWTGPPMESLTILAATPVDTEITESSFAYSAKRVPGRDTDAAVATMYVKLDADMRADMRIWENKAYLDKPLLVDGDGPIPTYRRWIHQFHD